MENFRSVYKNYFTVRHKSKVIVYAYLYVLITWAIGLVL